MTAERVRAQRDDRLLAYITRKAPVTRAAILSDLSTLCGGRRGIDTTIARLLAREAIVLNHAAVHSAACGRKVGVYVPAKAQP